MKITAAESRVMEVLWRQGSPMAADEVAAALDDEAEWTPGTVRTLLTRLVKRKAAATRKDGKRYLYRPLISREDYAHQQGRTLIDRLFEGRITPFITQLVEREPISRDDLEDLKRLIERLDHER